ncbi:MAG: type II toxin-antitoxin system VapC family toxin [Chloroflexota bacterium]
MIVYVDTSAAMKLLVDEPESATLAEYLQHCTADGDTLAASLLLHTELHCAANRHASLIDQGAVSAVLSVFSLVDIDRTDLTTAPLLSGRLRSADAIHLATAVRLAVDTMVVYDAELQAAGRHAGIHIISPGAQ